jgi:phospholipase/carboxylesterase
MSAVATNPHLSTATVTAGNPDAAVAAVLVHGRDQDPEFMLEVAGRIGLDDRVAYVLPRAARRSWYHGRFYDPMADNEPWLGWALEAIGAAVAGALFGEHGVNDDEAAAVGALLTNLMEPR